MCGIAGRFDFDASRRSDPEVLKAMTDALSHRGPDAAGYFIDGGIALGHRRLSIIDLSTGDQPLSNETGSIQVVFNGEIYNFAEVRAELEAKGHRFRTRSDTEVIVHGYEEWGERCVERFRGMFAFALWDAPQHRLMLARDRLGVKPLYYAELPGGIVFGSEIKAILEDSDVSREWLTDAVDAYLTFLYVPAPRTIYRAIKKLPAAHVLVAERGSSRMSRYWDLQFTGDGDSAREEEYLEELHERLNDAVRLRLVSDVPLGAFLSGGIDSTTVVACMTETSATPPITISVGFDEGSYDEVEHARAVADHLGCEFHALVASPQLDDLLPRLAWHFDEPFADSSAVPTYYVSQAARRLVTVALSGDGGDELWAGYSKHRVERWEHGVRRVLGRAAPVLGRLAHALPLSVRGARALRHLAVAPDQAFALKQAYGMFEPDAKARLYTGDLAAAVDGTDPLTCVRDSYGACGSSDPLDKALYADSQTYMIDDILTKVDRMSMAVSLEAREPLLDHKLLEFAARVPSTLKLKHNRSKYLLRRALERRVPAAILERPKKGFDAPIADWLRGPLAPLTVALLFDGRLKQRGLFNDREVSRLWNEHRTQRADHRHRLWQLLMLELWFRQFVDGSPRHAAARAEAPSNTIRGRANPGVAATSLHLTPRPSA
jgi:asparagine synthase (glutamine-hydrolysing)